MEIERKFLVKKSPDVSGVHGASVKQWYVSLEPQVRVRLIDGEYILTEKSGKGLSRTEVESTVSAERAAALLEGCDKKPVEKTRYRIPVGSFTAEYDVYGGENQGLQVVEVEFPSVEEALSFEIPCWFGEEVTDDEYYKNSSIFKRINGM